MWKRSGKLYKYNLMVIGVSLLGALVIARLTGVGNMSDGLFLKVLAHEDHVKVAWHVLTLQQSVGYSMVLRLYVALMLIAPFLLWLASRRWWYALAPAVVLWALAGQFGWVEHDSLTHTPLTLTILPWTLVFTCGLALGAGIVQGVRMPRSPFLLGAALTMILSYLALLYALPLWPAEQAWVDARELHFWLGSSKSYESPLRLFHLLSLVYVFTAFPDAPVLRLVHQVRAGAFLARIGRRSLPIFTFGAIYASLTNEVLRIIERVWGEASPLAIGFELIVVISALAVMGLIADRGRRRASHVALPKRPATAPIPAEGVT